MTNTDVRTRQDLIVRVLTLLGAAGIGQTPTAEDHAAVEKQVDTTLDQLMAKKIYDFPSRLEFDSAIIQPLAVRLATVVGPDLAIASLVGYGGATLPEIAALAEQEIRFIAAEDQSKEPIVFQDF